MSARLEMVAAPLSLLGECPLWDAAAQTIWWVDILRGEIHACGVETRAHRRLTVGQPVGAVALGGSGQLVGALQEGFYYITPEGGLDPIAQPEAHLPGNRFNDGKCDPAGRFWAGTMSLSGEAGAGSLYALEPNGTVTLKIPGVSVSNGMAWSPEASLFYYIDTPTSVVMAYAYEVHSGALGNPRVAVRIPPPMGKPDGMCIDEEGMLWIALWGGSQVTRWHPQTGRLLHQVALPVGQVSSCTFGGSALEDLYVTTASVGLTEKEKSAQPAAGALFVLKNSGFRGLPSVRFRD